MAEQIIPTKGNLMNAKRSLALADSGYELMERKRKVLLREISERVEKYEQMSKEVKNALRSAMYKLSLATTANGLPLTAAQAVPTDDSVTIRSRSVMGVEIPEAEIEESDCTLFYGLTYTAISLDEAYEEFNRLKYMLVDLAALETSIFRLREAMNKTVKRSNALGNVVIPKYSETVKIITTALEEKEREEFTRLKVVKNKDLKNKDE